MNRPDGPNLARPLPSISRPDDSGTRGNFNDLSEVEKMSETDQATHTWPELAAGLYDKLTGRNAEITYEFDQFSLHVPSSTGPDAEHAHWRVDGTLRIRTRDRAAADA